MDVGSDILWVPCDCVQCAPLSASYYSSLVGRLSMIMLLNTLGALFTFMIIFTFFLRFDPFIYAFSGIFTLFMMLVW